MFKNVRILLRHQNYFTSTERSYARRSGNAGVRIQSSVINKNNKNDLDIDDFDSLDTDFSNLPEMHKLYEKETKAYREQTARWIVKNKYFKKNNFNFLTWAEKEQIRYLHTNESEIYCVEKLAESFPADISTIVKLVKANWYPRDKNRIQKHDLAVKKNWELFKQGKIPNLDINLRDHLKKFADRKLIDTSEPSSLEKNHVFQVTEPKVTEFSNILTSCKKYATTPQSIHQTSFKNKQEPNNEDTYLISPTKDQRLATLSEMRSKNKILEAPKNNENDMNLYLADNPNGTSVINLKTDGFNMSESKFDEKSVEVIHLLNDGPKVAEIREYIKIPKKLFQRGATYKLDDCFYADDGEFLYRVPGMTGKH